MDEAHDIRRSTGAASRSIPVAALLVMGICAAFGLASLWPMLDAIWSNIYGAFSHGYLVVILCVWLAVRNWRQSPPSHLQPAWIAAVALAAVVCALIAMDLLFLNSSRLVLLPIVVLAAVALAFGWSAARSVFWPCVFLYFALPQWWAINGQLQSAMSAIVAFLVELTKLPAYVEGNFIRVPAGMFEIASGCSGLNYLVAALSLAGFYALMYLTRWKSRLKLLAAATLAAMVSNVARIYSLIAIGIVTDMQHYLIRVDHLYFGWALFMAAMFPVFWLARKLDDADAAALPPTSPENATTPHMTVTTSVLYAGLAGGVILLLPAVVTFSSDNTRAQVVGLPDQFGGWRHSGARLSVWQPTFINAQAERASYAKETTTVELYRGAYPQQSDDARVIRTENDFLGAGWRLAESGRIQLDDANLEQVNESRGYLQERERLIWSWYVVAGKTATTKVGAKAQELRGFLQRRRDASALAISTECVPDCSEARARLADFMRESAASLR